MDLLIGGYAAAHLARLTDTEMNQFEIILEVPDQDLLAWLTGQAEVPAQHATPLLLDILKFRPTLTS